MNEVLAYPKVNTLQNQGEIIKAMRLSSVWCYSRDSSLCVCMWVGVCGCACMCVLQCTCTYVCVCWHQGYHSSPSCLSPALNFPSGHQPLCTSLVLEFYAGTTTSCFLHVYSGFGGLNLGSPACMASTLPTEQSPQPIRLNIAFTSFSYWPTFSDSESRISHQIWWLWFSF